MALRLVAAVAVVFVAAAATWPDEAGDVEHGRAPDVVAVTVTNSATQVTFSVRFARTPPLTSGKGFVDMMLVGLDVPPIGAPPVEPGGEWPGGDYALGVHGASTTGQLVGAGWREGAIAKLRVVTRGRTVTVRVQRRLIGNPHWFRFVVAAAREGEQEGAFDVVPQRGTLRYVLR